MFFLFVLWSIDRHVTLYQHIHFVSPWYLSGRSKMTKITITLAISYGIIGYIHDQTTEMPLWYKRLIDEDILTDRKLFQNFSTWLKRASIYQSIFFCLRGIWARFGHNYSDWCAFVLYLFTFWFFFSF